MIHIISWCGVWGYAAGSFSRYTNKIPFSVDLRFSSSTKPSQHTALRYRRTTKLRMVWVKSGDYFAAQATDAERVRREKREERSAVRDLSLSLRPNSFSRSQHTGSPAGLLVAAAVSPRCQNIKLCVGTAPIPLPRERELTNQGTKKAAAFSQRRPSVCCLEINFPPSKTQTCCVLTRVTKGQHPAQRHNVPSHLLAPAIVE